MTRFFSAATVANVIALTALAISIGSLAVANRTDDFSRRLAIADRKAEISALADTSVALATSEIDELNLFIEIAKNKVSDDTIKLLVKGRDSALNELEARNAIVRKLENADFEDPAEIAKIRIRLSRSNTELSQLVGQITKERREDEEVLRRVKAVQKTTP